MDADRVAEGLGLAHGRQPVEEQHALRVAVLRHDAELELLLSGGPRRTL